jgi:hypothetical protein
MLCDNVHKVERLNVLGEIHGNLRGERESRYGHCIWGAAIDLCASNFSSGAAQALCRNRKQFHAAIIFADVVSGDFQTQIISPIWQVVFASVDSRDA